ncbi:MAG TPA: tRNA lysidine(34) synthetase TilS [Actinomycetes bacterium]|nr:tRNA lysidine(34) synthetase TilS [Actinomycetes bacterium]
MIGPPPAVARVRSAVRAELEDIAPGSLVLAAVSGGRDSLALADGCAFEAPKLALQCGGLIVDHGLQPGSRDVANEIALVLRSIGLEPVEVLTVTVAETGSLEAAARSARYGALEVAAERLGSATVLLGHTLDDQAETVLLGLGRGSGARSLSGMARRRGIYRRPLLGLDRHTTGDACVAAGLKPWDDPHNDDARFRRVLVRHRVLPVLEEQLGPGVAQALARSAEMLRDDDIALEHWAADVHARATADSPAEGLDCAVLSEVPAAVRRRVLRLAALTAGVPGGALRQSQLLDVDLLVAGWHGQGAVDLPGGVSVSRLCGRLRFTLARPSASIDQPQHPQHPQHSEE